MTLARSLTVLLLAAFVPTFAAADDPTGAPRFTQAGYPAIAVIGAFMVLIAALFAGTKNGLRTGLRGNLFFTLFNIYLFIAGIFLIFGPHNGTANVATQGISIALTACLGFYAAMVNLPAVWLAYTLLAVYDFLSIIGANTLFNYTTPIWITDQTNCDNYFQPQAGTHMQRCYDTEFLQLLRVLGVACLPFLAMTAIHALTAFSDNRTNYNRGSLTNAQPVAGGAGYPSHQPLVVQQQGAAPANYTNPPPV